VFNALNYIGFTSPNAQEWSTFGPGILGLELAGTHSDGTVKLRMDDAAHRIAIHPGESDDLSYLGWGVSDPADLPTVAALLTAAGIKVNEGDAHLTEDRAVLELLWFQDPFGVRNEVSWGQLTRPASFRPGRALSGFVTQEMGLGHAAVIVPDLKAADAFYRKVLGFQLSDQVNAHGVRIRFYHCNSRHHSLALVEIPGLVGFHHLMLETRSIDDVGRAHDLARQTGIDITMGFGRHVNDLMTSFYLRTPSSFEIEYGYGGLVLDRGDESELRSYTSFSIWGHHFTSGAPAPPGIARPFEETAC
jgi:extradiol dioxygenase